VFAADLELDRSDVTRAAAPGNDFLNVRSTHFEIVIEKSSRIRWHALPTLADVLNHEIPEFDFFTSPVFHTCPVRRLLFRRGMSVTEQTGESQQAPEHEDKSRIISHVSVAFPGEGEDLFT